MMEVNDGNHKTNSHWSPFVDTDKQTICIDFHHTITQNCEACGATHRDYVLQDGVVEAIQKLSKKFRIVIYSGDPTICIQEGKLPNFYRENIIKFLANNHIPFDDIFFTKPPAMFIIDDRAIHHEGWDKTLSEVERRIKS